MLRLLSVLSLLFSVIPLHASPTTIEDLPTEMIEHIMRQGPPSHLASTNRRFSEIPLICEHYPHLLNATVDHYRNGVSNDGFTLEKCVQLVRKSPRALKCFGTNSLEVALGSNATEIVDGLWSRRNELNSEAKVREMFGASGHVLVLLMGREDMFNYLFERGVYTQVPTITFYQVASGLNQKDPSLQRLFSALFSGALRTRRGQTSLYAFAAAIGGNLQILRRLIQAGVQVGTAAIEPAMHCEAFETAAFLYKNAQLPLENYMASNIIDMFRNHNVNSEVQSYLAQMPVEERDLIVRFFTFMDDQQALQVIRDALEPRNSAPVLILDMNPRFVRNRRTRQQ
jgi:hypothetical protein